MNNWFVEYGNEHLGNYVEMSQRFLPDWYGQTMVEFMYDDTPAQPDESNDIIRLHCEAILDRMNAAEHDRSNHGSMRARRFYKKQARKNERRAGKLMIQEAI